MTFVRADAGEWLESPDAAGTFRILRVHEGGGVTIEVSIPAGVIGNPHRHPKGEELFMVSGEVEIDGLILRPGDYMYTPPGAVHRARAITDARFALVLPDVPEYL